MENWKIKILQERKLHQLPEIGILEQTLCINGNDHFIGSVACLWWHLVEQARLTSWIQLSATYYRHSRSWRRRVVCRRTLCPCCASRCIFSSASTIDAWQRSSKESAAVASGGNTSTRSGTGSIASVMDREPLHRNRVIRKNALVTRVFSLRSLQRSIRRFPCFLFVLEDFTRDHWQTDTSALRVHDR